MKTIALLLFAPAATAQSLVPVADAGGANWTAILIVAVVVAVVAGLIVWHRRSPSTEARALSEANAALTAALSKAHDALEWAHSHAAVLVSKVPDQVDQTVVIVPAGPTPEQLAAVESAEKALHDAQLAAGIKT